MSKFRFRSFLDDGLFVVLVMLGAIASAALEAGAVIGGLPGGSLSAYAVAAPVGASAATAAASAPERILAAQSVVRPARQQH
jgi:hypothetical protein